MTADGESAHRYIAPKWPHERFFLVAIPDGWSLGPFEPDPACWGTMPNGAVCWADGYTHPVVLKVRSQEGDVVHANDGDMGDMSYRIVPLSKAPREWLGLRA